MVVSWSALWLPSFRLVQVGHRVIVSLPAPDILCAEVLTNSPTTIIHRLLLTPSSLCAHLCPRAVNHPILVGNCLIDIVRSFALSSIMFCYDDFMAE